ncbi:hypothetical protein AB0H67_24870 [Streptomyces phaeochromogenes]|uniref:hypothetical protein n=1 Tax=Streptomyces phaeochromogenes TaxID=1923 RepID=UPI0033CC559B
MGSENVTTVEVAAELAELAKARLRKAGWKPTVFATDRRAGHPAGAPYDRLIATCGFDGVPHAWIEQVRPGGVIVCPVGWGIVRLDVGGDGTASGRFLPSASYFMSVRAADETGAVPYPEVPNALDERCTALDVSAPFGTDTFRSCSPLPCPAPPRRQTLTTEGTSSTAACGAGTAPGPASSRAVSGRLAHASYGTRWRPRMPGGAARAGRGASGSVSPLTQTGSVFGWTNRTRP